MQFARYHDLKEQESLLMELRNMILLEKSYVELLDREVSSVESENKRLENLVVLYLKVLDQLQQWKSESGLLKRKVKKLVRKTKELSDITREQNLKIESADAELLRNCDVLEEKSNAIQKLENELKELHSVIDQLQEQNSELLNKLQEWHQSASSVTKVIHSTFLHKKVHIVSSDFLGFDKLTSFEFPICRLKMKEQPWKITDSF